MCAIPAEEATTDENFDEARYLRANPDVAAAVARGECPSARAHFEAFGRAEGRRQRAGRSLAAAKRRKLDRIRPILRDDMPFEELPGCFDFLSVDLRDRSGIVDTHAISDNEYDPHVLGMIERHADGLVLDCGSGRRAIYYENVVNFEVVEYDTTDVRGVGEELPFRDESFDAVISVAVLEHVKDPFRCADEIARVLKGGGELICCVPFLQPYHGYPHHYYNMTDQGLRNLFEPRLRVDRIEVYESVLPIWSLSWIVRSWSEGLTGATREAFLDMRLRDLLAPMDRLTGERFVTELGPEKNAELAAANVLFATKPPQV